MNMITNILSLRYSLRAIKRKFERNLDDQEWSFCLHPDTTEIAVSVWRRRERSDGSAVFLLRETGAELQEHGDYADDIPWLLWRINSKLKEMESEQ